MTFDETLDKNLRREFLEHKKDMRVLGYGKFVVMQDAGGELSISWSTGGFWKDEMAPHMEDPTVKAIREWFHAMTKSTGTGRDFDPFS